MRAYSYLVLFFFSCRAQPEGESAQIPNAVPTSVSASQPTSQEEQAAKVTSELVDPAFVETLLQIAKGYSSYGRTNDFYLWAPGLCGVPRVARPGAYVSESVDKETHGKKIYSLFTGFYQEPPAPPPTKLPKKIEIHFPDSGLLPTSPAQAAYLGIAHGKPVPEGLAIVKEAWLPKEITNSLEASQARAKKIIHESSGTGGFPQTHQHEFWPYAEKDGKLFTLGEKVALFIMFKTKDDTPGTDQGWVYGTVSADGKEVTSAGTLRKCMGCHKQAPYGRLFIDKRSGG